MKIRKTTTGKLHLSGGAYAANCSAGNRGMNFIGRVDAKKASTFPKECFCKKCFGNDPYLKISRLMELGLVE